MAITIHNIRKVQHHQDTGIIKLDYYILATNNVSYIQGSLQVSSYVGCI